MFREGRSRACVNLRRPERLSRAHEIKSVCTPVLLTRLVCAYGREKKCGVLNVFSFPKYSFERETSYYRATKKKKNIGTNVQRLYGVHGHLFSITLSN